MRAACFIMNRKKGNVFPRARSPSKITQLTERLKKSFVQHITRIRKENRYGLIIEKSCK